MPSVICSVASPELFPFQTGEVSSQFPCFLTAASDKNDWRRRRCGSMTKTSAEGHVRLLPQILGRYLRHAPPTTLEGDTEESVSPWEERMSDEGGWATRLPLFYFFFLLPLRFRLVCANFHPRLHGYCLSVCRMFPLKVVQTPNKFALLGYWSDRNKICHRLPFLQSIINSVNI